MAGTISVADANAAIAVSHLATFTPVPGSFFVQGLAEQSGAGITISPALSAGAFAIEGSGNGQVSWAPLLTMSPDGTATAATTPGGTLVRTNVTGLTHVRVRALLGAAFGNGPISVSVTADSGMMDAPPGSGGTVPAGAATSALQSTGNTSLATLATNSPALVGGAVPVVDPDETVTGTLTAAWNGVGSPSASQAVVLALTGGEASWTLELSGTFSAGSTLNPEGTIDGTLWNPLTIEGGGTTGVTSLANTITGTGAAVAASGGIRGLAQLRFRASALLGGDSVTVTARSSSAPGGIRVASLPATASQPTASSSVLVTAGATSTQTKTITNTTNRTLVVVLNTTTASGGNTVQVTINGVTTSGFVYTVLTATAVAVAGVFAYSVGPGVNPVSGVSAGAPLPSTVQVVLTVVGSVAYGADYILGN